MPESPCVFCEIVAGREVASVVHEDDLTMAFMVLRPTQAGELTVIPKAHNDHFCDVPDPVATAVLTAGQRLCRALRAEFAAPRVGYVVHGFGVPHAHLIVVPLHEPADITSRAHIQIQDGQVELGVSRLRAPPRDELDEAAARIRTRVTALAQSSADPGTRDIG